MVVNSAADSFLLGVMQGSESGIVTETFCLCHHSINRGVAKAGL